MRGSEIEIADDANDTAFLLIAKSVFERTTDRIGKTKLFYCGLIQYKPGCIGWRSFEVASFDELKAEGFYKVRVGCDHTHLASAVIGLIFGASRTGDIGNADHQDDNSLTGNNGRHCNGRHARNPLQFRLNRRRAASCSA